MKKYYLHTFIFLISTSVLAYELLLSRIFSIIFTANIAFLAISFALFGLALGGVLVYISPKYFSEQFLKERLSFFCLGYSLSLIFLVFFLIVYPYLLPNVVELILAVTILISLIPFVLSNICLAFIFKMRAENISGLYFADMIGAGCGVILNIFLMNYLSILPIIIIASILGLAALLFVASAGGFKGYVRKLVLILILVIIIIFNQKSDVLNTQLAINKLSDYSGDEFIFTKSNSFSYVTVVKDRLETKAIANRFKLQEGPEIKGIFIDGGAYTPMIKFNGDLNSVEYLSRDFSSLVFEIVKRGKVMIIGPGGGRDVLMALLADNQVVGVEINPIIVNDLMKDKFKEFSGELYSNNPNVEIINSEGRSYINKDSRKYNAISIPFVDTWASTSAGNFALVENFLYTVEAFEQYLKHLDTDGVLQITRWDLDGGRLLPMYLEVSKKIGIQNPEKNIVVVTDNFGAIRESNRNNYMFKIAPFTEEEILKIKTFCEDNGNTLLFAPDGGEYDSKEYDFLMSGDKENYIKNNIVDMRPVYDNNPFFFYRNQIGKFYGEYNSIGNTLYITLVIAFIAALIILIWPLIKNRGLNLDRNNLNSSLLYLGYFGSLGVAFMLIEITLIQKFVLYLETPIYSYSVILVALLIFSGLGSLASGFIKAKKISFILIGLVIFSLISGYVLFLQGIILSTISWDIFAKIMISVVSVAPIAFLMGMMLPLGIKRISGLNFLIPWAWAINGAMSVLATALAVALAIVWGFNFVLFFGGLVYLIAVIFIILSKKIELIST